MADKTARSGKRGKSGKPKRRWVKWLKITFAVGVLLLLVAAIAGGIVWQMACDEARPEVRKFLQAYQSMQVQPSQIVSSDGQLLYQVSGEMREYLKLNDIPKVVRDAVIAAEDRRFYDHSGVDLRALFRMAFTNARDMRVAQGGSTLTMQLAKRIASSGERSWRRKLHDMALAVAVEQDLSKDTVLELYLNQVYFGSHAYGVQAASKVYFGKPVSKLTIGEAAMLARCVRRPSDENPFADLDKAMANRDVVLRIMLDERMITHEQYEKALDETPHLNPRPPTTSAQYVAAPYFVNHVLAVFKREFPDVQLDDGGYRIETTLDSRMQAIAEREVHDIVTQFRRSKVTTAAFVLMDSQGRVLAEVGGADFNKDQVNVVCQGTGRQPGSSFKPIVYATALSQGKITPDSMISDDKITFPAPPGGKAWTPHNDNNKYGGQVSVRQALAMSINVVAARICQMVTPQAVVETARDTFGYTSRLHAYPSIALGTSDVHPLEQAQAYSVFMLHGDRATPYVITKVVGPDGATLQQYDPRIVRSVLDRAIADDMDDLLRGVALHGTGWMAGRDVENSRGKTGTTQDNKDAWFCGYADGLVGVGWVANERHLGKRPSFLPMSREVFGGTVTVRMWSAIMKEAIKVYGHKLAEEPAPVDHTGPSKPAPNPDAEDVTVEVGNGNDTGAPPAAPAALPTSPPEGDVNSPPDQSGDAGSAGGVDGAPPKATEQPKIAASSKDSGGQSPLGPTPAGYVDVEICSDSKKRASIYCPDVVTRRYKKGTEPKQICPIHHG